MRSKVYALLFVLIVFNSCQQDTTEVFEDMETIMEQEIDLEIVSPTNESFVSYDPTKNWVFQMQKASGLLESAENTDLVSLYDNSLAAIFFIHENQLEKAEEIFDFYLSKLYSELIPNGGFYQFRNSKGEEAERIWMGDNAWLLIALNHYEEKYQSSKYSLLAEQLEIGLRLLQEEDGSLRGGTNSDGSEIPKVTEGIITAFNAVKGFDDFHKNILRFLEAERWDTKNEVLLAWPENPNYAYALDLHSLGSSIFQDFSVNILLEAERYINEQEMMVNGEEISGYCFDEDKDVIWLEGTAQMAVAFQSAQRQDIANTLLSDLEKTFIKSAIIENSQGIPYVSNHGTSYGTSELWDHAAIAPALSSTIWYLFAKEKFNPLTMGSQKEIPSIYKFWMK